MKKFLAACLFPVFLAITADADIIYFKDGMKTICQDKAWEENDQVKCEYGGWVLTYQKSDVLRILKSRSSKPATEPAIKDPKKDQVKIPPRPAGGITKQIDPKKTKGLTFYDPRRPYKYWTDHNSKHKSYKEAIQALSLKYGRSPEWIRNNMGQTNDLSEIHQNLRTQQSAESSK
ncbi:MAG: hypothetical protein JRF56_01160 [Deltaproteobacteria bacterium]|nr:hypothetical protein [Deltaproteobacteria bacterium]